MMRIEDSRQCEGKMGIPLHWWSHIASGCTTMSVEVIKATGPIKTLS